jgi:hypothetical protein
MPNDRKYTMGLTLWLAVYAVLLFAAISLVNHHLVSGIWRIPVALAPMLAGIGIVHNTVSRFQRMDELEQKIQLVALAYAFGSTALITFSYGFLESLADAPMASYFWVWPILALSWTIAQQFARRRFA